MKHKIIILTLVIGCLASCSNQRFGAREAGVLGGGALGAGLGAIIGNQTGSSGAGIAIGSAVGAITGGLIGNEMDRQNDALDARQEKLGNQQQQIEENQRIIDELRRRGADVRRTDRGVVVNLPDVLFDFNSAKLTDDARRASAEIASVVSQYPNRNISVEGHTDSVGTIEYNKRLSEDRARSVADELAYQGVPKRRISTYGYGESDPIASNRSDLGRQRNRRVEVIIEN